MLPPIGRQRGGRCVLGGAAFRAPCRLGERRRSGDRRSQGRVPHRNLSIPSMNFSNSSSWIGTMCFFSNFGAGSVSYGEPERERRSWDRLAACPTGEVGRFRLGAFSGQAGSLSCGEPERLRPGRFLGQAGSLSYGGARALSLGRFFGTGWEPDLRGARALSARAISWTGWKPAPLPGQTVTTPVFSLVSRKGIR